MFIGRKYTNREIAAMAKPWRDSMLARTVVDVTAAHSRLAVNDIAGQAKSKTNGSQSRVEQVKNARTPEDFANLYRKKKDQPTPNNGGLETDRAARKAEREALAANEVEGAFFAKEKRWYEKKGQKRKWSAKVGGVDLRKEVTLAIVGPTLTTKEGDIIADPDYVKCSFCDTFIHRTQATFGKGRLRDSRVTELVNINGVDVMQTRFIKTSPNLVACVDHCLELVDRKIGENSDGEPIYSGTKTTFPVTF